MKEAWINDLDTQAIIDLRKKCNENQTDFWLKFGVTQSRGSRFEAGAEIPATVLLLIKLYLKGTVKDRDLIKM